ncbi:Kelch repeat-containing protein-like protein 3 [Verticillium dahliae]
MTYVLVVCFLAAFAGLTFGQFEGWIEGQVNVSMCLGGATKRGAFIRDTVLPIRSRKGSVRTRLRLTSLPAGMTRYVAYGGAVSVPSENIAWYFSGVRAPNWGPVFQRNMNLTENALNTSNTLLTLDMATQTNLVWTNNTFPGGVKCRANPEVVWVPVGEQSILVVIGGVTYPDWLTSTRKSENPNRSTIHFGGPTARTRACAVVASAQDRSSFNIYYYGGYPGVDPKVEMNDEVWVQSLPSFTWTRLSEGRPGRGRNGHKCFMPYPDQMMVIGGMTSEAGDNLECLTGLIQIYNLTRSQWMDGYDPERRGYLTTPSPSGWSDDKLADVFATPYSTSKIQNWYPYQRVTEASQPTFEPGGDGKNASGDSGDGGGMPKWVGPTLGAVLGFVFLVAFLAGFCLWRRRKLCYQGARTEYNGTRILSWIRGQPTEDKALTLTTLEELPSNADTVVGHAASSPSVPILPVVSQSEMMDTTIAELPGLSLPPTTSISRLTSTTEISQGLLSSLIQALLPCSSVSDDVLSASRSSGVLGPRSLADSPTRSVVSPIDAPGPAVGMRDRILSVVSGMSDRDTGHLRQISEVTVNAASDAGSSSPATIISPLDVSAAHITMSIPIPISPPTAGLSFEDEGDRTAPTPTGLFELLPNELITLLASLLPVTDVISLKRATHDLLPVLDQRIDPAEYLQRVGPFTGSDELLETMATHGAVLSGSRALEYFVPGSATDASDWDFYVPPVLSSVVAVKNALERSGVTSESSLARAARKLRDESFVTLSRNQVISTAYEAYLETCQWPPGPRCIVAAVHKVYPELQDMAPLIRADGSVRWLETVVPIRIDDGGSTSFPMPEQQRFHSYPNNIATKVLCGSACKNNKTVSVQLVIGFMDPRGIMISEPLLQTVFRSIFSFYGSHVQCFLTKHAAFHMHYKLALEKTAYQWQVPESIREKAEAAVQKYSSRGFEFKTALEGDTWEMRTAKDSKSCLLVFDTNSAYQPPISLIRDLRWHHSGQHIRPYLRANTISARREMLRFGMVSRYSSLN